MRSAGAMAGCSIWGLGGTWSSAYAVNAGGEIVGTGAIGNGLSRAFFSNGVGMASLGTFAGTNGSSYAMGVNQFGQIVGDAQTAQGFAHAFLWDGAALIDLGTLGGTQSYAYGVNDAETVVGKGGVSVNFPVSRIRSESSHVCASGTKSKRGGLVALLNKPVIRPHISADKASTEAQSLEPALKSRES